MQYTIHINADLTAGILMDFVYHEAIVNSIICDKHLNPSEKNGQK